MVRIHKREQPTDQAQNELSILMLKFWEDNPQLTDGEIIRVFTSAYNSVMQAVAKAMIRMERHGNYDEPGGWE